MLFLMLMCCTAIQFSFFILHPIFPLMPLTQPTLKKELKRIFTQITKTQSEALAIQIAANFTAGQTAAEKHKSIKSADPDDDTLTDKEKTEIAALTALYLGYISEFNSRAQAQIMAKVQELTEAGSTQDEIKQYIDSVLAGEESIVIDNVGKKRKEIYVDEDLKLSEVTKTVENPYYSSVLAYASLIGAMAAHTAYEKGKELYNRENGYGRWVFVGPADERARAWHVALLGKVFEHDTVQSNYAEQCLNEPRCRHRKEVWYGDSRDTAPEKWEQLKKDAGLFWDDQKKQWSFK